MMFLYKLVTANSMYDSARGPNCYAPLIRCYIKNKRLVLQDAFNTGMDSHTDAR